MQAAINFPWAIVAKVEAGLIPQSDHSISWNGLEFWKQTGDFLHIL
jgi:hypothetical protein